MGITSQKGALMKIKDIATTAPGLVTTRKKASNKYKIEKTYPLLTLNAIDSNGSIDRTQLTQLESIEKLNDQYFTQEEDILVRLNEPFTAIYINKANEGILIPSYFVKLQVTHKDLKPAYIAWYLNSQKVKRDFLRSQSGTLVPSINQRVISNIEVPIKSMEEQEDIVSLYALYIKEMNLMERLKEERRKQFNTITEKFIKK